jgi:hypothetical protein
MVNAEGIAAAVSYSIGHKGKLRPDWGDGPLEH